MLQKTNNLNEKWKNIVIEDFFSWTKGGLNFLAKFDRLDEGQGPPHGN